MRYLQVSSHVLTNRGFSQPSQANTFFPAGNSTDHIHLGVPTTYLRQGSEAMHAEAGNLFVTYVSFKRNDRFWFRLRHDPEDGYFDFPSYYSAAVLPAGWREGLTALGIVRGLGT